MADFATFNINDYVWFKLTPHGARVWGERLQAVFGGTDTAWFPPEPESDGYHSLQMHAWMRIFGSHMGAGCELCFETTIRVQAKDLTVTASPAANPFPGNGGPPC